MQEAKAAYIAAADPAGDDPSLVQALRNTDFIVVQEMFMTETARMADVILPVQAYTEREGTFTSGERRIQRYYPAVSPMPGTRPDFAITAQIGGLLGISLESRAPSLVFLKLAGAVAAFIGLDYQKLSEVGEQWPVIGRSDLYFGGTSYDNHQGLGVQMIPTGQRLEPLNLPDMPDYKPLKVPEGGLLVVPVTKLYDRGRTIVPSSLLHDRMVKPELRIHPDLAQKYGLLAGQDFQFFLNGAPALVKVVYDENTPDNAALLPRSTGLPANGPAVAQFEKVIR
jgi:NADH-quinone oxidoreductase subunit G